MGIDYTVYMLVQSSNIKSLDRLSGHRFTHAARALWQQKYEKNCIHSIKYKYLTETMYLWYLLISNIEYRNGEKNMTGGSESKTLNLCQCDVFTNTYTISLQTFLHYSGLQLWTAFFFCFFHEILFSHFNAFTHSHTVFHTDSIFCIFVL